MLSLTYMLIIYFLFFEKKLVVLLSLEGMMLSLIILSQGLSFCSYSCIFILTIFSIFMVLDSVFGISLLISSSRFKNESMKIF